MVQTKCSQSKRPRVAGNHYYLLKPITIYLSPCTVPYFKYVSVVTSGSPPSQWTIPQLYVAVAQAPAAHRFPVQQQPPSPRAQAPAVAHKPGRSMGNPQTGWRLLGKSSTIWLFNIAMENHHF